MTNRRGSSLIITMWLVVGLVAITLSLGHSQMFSHRCSSNEVNAIQAEQAISGALSYITSVLESREDKFRAPTEEKYNFEAVEVGACRFWILGNAKSNKVSYGLVDEAAKLNINTATVEMLQQLPGITEEIAAAIIDWRDEDSTVTPNGAENESYARLDRPYLCRNAPFESIGELALVYGIEQQHLYGKDLNLNGVIEAWEEGSDVDHDFGLFHYTTVYSREPSTDPDGEALININDRNTSKLQQHITDNLDASKAQSIIGATRVGNTTYSSVLAFYMASGIKAEDFAKISDKLVIGTRDQTGLVNVNTAPAAVLACLPNVGEENAAKLVNYREKETDKLGSVAWIVDALGKEAAAKLGNHFTVKSYQFSADIVALGPNDRGQRRIRFVIDCYLDTPAVVRREDRGTMAWCLGPRESLADNPL